VPWSKRISIQRCAGVSRMRAAKSRTPVTWSRVRSNHSMISSMLAPASRFSKTVATGIRVPRKTHAPLTFPGMLSTAGHCDQSSAAITSSFGLSLTDCHLSGLEGRSASSDLLHHSMPPSPHIIFTLSSERTQSFIDIGFVASRPCAASACYSSRLLPSPEPDAVLQGKRLKV